MIRIDNSLTECIALNRFPGLMRSIVLTLLIASNSFAADAQKAQIATFDVDATPPVGSHMAYDPVKRHDELTLRARGVVLIGAEKPIVLCNIDWIGIGNDGHDTFRKALAEAAGTTIDRVAVHTGHQHDAPACDFGAEAWLKNESAPNLGRHDGSFAREVIERLQNAIRTSMKQPVPISHVGVGVAKVEKVASNRRILGTDGKVRATRFTATKEAHIRAEPEGTIDPELSALSFWNGESPVAVLTYYACHPQSYYRMGIPSSDFPGIARFFRGQAVPEALHVHFNGAGGNIGAGKYNDGSKENRVELALRMATGMKAAFEATNKQAISSDDIRWRSLPVNLPAASHLIEALSQDRSKNPPGDHWSAAALVFAKRMQEGHTIDIGCLKIGPVRVLHMPGELFVEYQLAAKSMRPELKVMMAAYGDYGPMYIGTARAYKEGGYETSPRASSVAPDVEEVLTKALRDLLRTPKSEATTRR
jgi:hypothetical protein